MGDNFYLGRYEHSLDAQYRVAIPSEWRDGDACAFILFKGHDRTLTLFPVEVFMEFVNRVRGGSFASFEIQELLAWVGERTRRCQCDKQGRVKLDKDMLDACGIGSQLELVGAVTHILMRAPRMPGDSEVRDNAFFAKLKEFSGDGGSDFLRGLLASVDKK
ncbi:MAG: hypothetical protein PHI85_03815 [Victivallaceae bacterium]|nr:hypothetical protein [Victivallaceae bacterium]